MKPGNVIVDAAGRVKVLDFGLAAWRPRPASPGDLSAGPAGLTEVAPGAVVGTIAYMSPSRRGAARWTRADIFSLGVLLWRRSRAGARSRANAVETLDRSCMRTRRP